MVVRSCKNGEIKTISTNQPMKLARGSYRIIGIPKLAMSLAGPKSIWMDGPHRTSIPSSVIAEVTKAYKITLRKTIDKDVVVEVTYLTVNQPTKKPNRIQKMGTPMPIPTQMTSSTTKIMKTHTGFFASIQFIGICLRTRIQPDENDCLIEITMIRAYK
jgi:hypothetical protein